MNKMKKGWCKCFMKLKHFLAEGNVQAAFFISPTGKIVYCGKTHIDLINKYPKKFGFTKDDIIRIHDKHKEKIGQEGNAREEIIRDLVDKGWIRIRRYPNKMWSININKLNKKVKDFLHGWANKILKGVQGFKEADKFMPVRIMPLASSDMSIVSKSFTVGDIANDVLIGEGVVDFGLTETEIEDFEDLV